MKSFIASYDEATEENPSKKKAKHGRRQRHLVKASGVGFAVVHYGLNMRNIGVSSPMVFFHSDRAIGASTVVWGFASSFLILDQVTILGSPREILAGSAIARGMRVTKPLTSLALKS